MAMYLPACLRDAVKHTSTLACYRTPLPVDVRMGWYNGWLALWLYGYALRGQLLNRGCAAQLRFESVRDGFCKSSTAGTLGWLWHLYQSRQPPDETNKAS